MLTVDFDRLDLRPGDRLLDMGCGGGRHAFEAMRRGATVVALDYSTRRAQGRARRHRRDGSRRARSRAAPRGGAVNGDALAPAVPRRRRSTASSRPRCSSTSGTTSGAIAELVRVLRPGGRMAVTVPTRWPERVCWALDHRLPRHARRARPHLPPARAREPSSRRAGLALRGSHHAHALHSPYWWLKCAVGVDNTDAWPVRKYHDFLVWQIVKQPAWLAHRRPRAEPGASARASSSTREKPCDPRDRPRPTSRHHQRATQLARDGRRDRARSSSPTATSRGSPGGHTDPWNLVEARDGARPRRAVTTRRARAYEWLRGMQHADGGVARLLRRRRGRGPDARHQRHLLRRDRRLAPLPHHRRHRVPRASSGRWSSARSTSRSTSRRETGEIAWRGDDPDDGALLTGSSSIHHSLRCAIAIAERLGHERPDWELSLGALAIAIAHRPDVFLDKDRWAMDWYYPILGGVLRGYAGARAHRDRLGDVRGRGPRRALRVRPSVGHRGRDVRAGDGARRDRRARAARASCSGGCSSCAPTSGGYWTGVNFDDERVRPPTASSTRPSSPRGTRPRSCSPPTRSAAPGPTAGLFRGERLPDGPQRRRAARRRRRDRTRPRRPRPHR